MWSRRVAAVLLTGDNSRYMGLGGLLNHYKTYYKLPRCIHEESPTLEQQTKLEYEMPPRLRGNSGGPSSLLSRQANHGNQKATVNVGYGGGCVSGRLRSQCARIDKT